MANLTIDSHGNVNVPLQPQDRHTHLHITVDYWQRRGFVCNVQAVEFKDGAMSFALCQSPNATITLEAASRNSAKKLKTWQESVANQLKNNSGAAWEMVWALLTKHGYNLAE